MGSSRWLVLLSSLAAFACGELEMGSLVGEPVPSVPPAPVVAPAVPLPIADPVAEPEPEELAPDPEAIARAAEEAARAAFDRQYPRHGVVYHFLGQVHKRPAAGSAVIGYMRRGAQFRAQDGLRGPGCSGGWYPVEGAGYVCRGDGFQLGASPQRFDPSPVSAAIDNALPYAYGWVARDDVPQYWALPTREQEEQARAWIALQRASARRIAEAVPSGDIEAVSEPQPDLEAPPGLAAGDEIEENPEPVDGGVAGASEPSREQPSILRMRMLRGFYVSIDRLETSEGRRFYRTVRGAYVPADAIAESQPPPMRGVVLGGRWALPIGFVYRGGVRSLSRAPVGAALRMGAPVDRLTPMPLQAEIIMRGGTRYRISDRGRIVREDTLRIAERIERPAQVGADERWIHVDLTRQIVVAYQGDRPVFATMVSTGRPGFETPVGTFRIQSKHVSTTMDDPDGGEEAYSIEDVPWTMYFEGSYALHAAFWHDRFGRPRSHGCVNLAPADARWLFSWTGPELPPGFHGMSATREAPGTVVHVTGTPE